MKQGKEKAGINFSRNKKWSLINRYQPVLKR
ncbi:hypothetical protein GTGU_02110 [Trabulsiella guamensis ATCC 49490]|uniref:Uncharacterized protein n=1 Tax=Trabulsiella guamensis ATCC 49490 TaxID=1005994 RepID=A0A085AA26_9ENTR|nr:hypothetical protein GTGU_02110 [Trabulsiella guamensis ATCC 49490]